MTVFRYKQPRDIKDEFTKFVNNLFKLNTSWVNEDVEVITLTGDNSPNAYEQYPWDTENYPIVVLFSEGSTDDRWALDERISDYREFLRIGSIPQDYVTLGVNPIAAGVRPQLSAMSLKSIDLLVKNIGPYEEPITVKLWSTVSDAPDTLLASGSISGQTTRGIEWLHTQLFPVCTLVKDTSYFLSAEAASGSYYWFIDNDVNTAITPYVRHATFDGTTWTSGSSQTPIAKVYGPTVRRLGGGIYSTIRMFVEAKDLATSQKITDLLFVYIHLAKHSNLGRREKLSDANVTSMDLDFVSDLSDKGIYIIDVNKGAETVRIRGNDRLFSIDLSLTCYSSWSEDFVLPVIEDIDITPDIESVQIVLNKYT